MRIFLILLFTITCANLCNPVFAQFGSTTIKQIDQIKNNNGTDIILDPVDKVMINYFTGGFALQSTATGELQESSVTNTELSYLSGATSSIQDQLDVKEDLLPWMNDGDLVYYDLGTASALAIGTNGQILTVSGGLPTWQNAPVSTTLTAKGDIQTHDGTANATLPVGTNGQILKANSATATGLEWVNDTSSSIFTDAFITVNDGNNQANADTLGAGIVVSMSDATDAALSYDSSTDSFFKMGEIGNQFEVVTTEHAQILENKTLNISEVTNPIRLDAKKDTQANLETYAGAATNGELAFATDTKSYYGIIDNALVDLGGGGNGFNYIENPTPKIDTSEWVTYQTNAFPFGCDRPYNFSLAPSGDFTWTRNTTNALNNVSDFLLTKAAGDRACNGVYTEFDILNGDLSGAMQLLEFAKLDSANYADGDIGIFLVTSSDNFATQNIIYPANEDMLGGTPSVFKQFQFNSTDTKARLVIHIKSSNTNAYTVQFNDFKLGRSPVATSAFRLDDKEYVPATTQGLGTIASTDLFHDVDGEYINISGKLVIGTPTAVEARIALPDGMVSSSAIPTLEIAGVYGQGNVGVVSGYVAIEPSKNYFVFTIQNAGNGALTKQNGSAIFGAGVTVSIKARIKIQGQSSNAASSIDLGTRDIKSRAINSATTAVGAGGAIHFGNVLENRGGAMWISSTQFTPLETSDYAISGQITATAAINTWNIFVYNVTDAVTASAGSIGFIDGAVLVTYSGTVPLIKGKIYEIRSSDAFTPVASSMTVVIKKLASPQTILPKEEVYGKYYNTSGQSIANNTPTTITNWTVSTSETSQTWMNTTTGETIIGQNGVFDFFASVGLTGLTTGTGDMRIAILKNGIAVTALKRGYLFSSDTANDAYAPNVSCVKGDIITVQITQTNGASRNLGATSTYNQFAFKRIN